MQRRAVSAFLAAARNGDFEALLEVLAPDVVVRFDLGPDREPRPTLTGARTVAANVLQTAPRFIAYARPAIVNGAAGLLFGTREAPIAVLGFTVSGARIAELDLVSDPAKLRHLAVQHCGTSFTSSTNTGLPMPGYWGPVRHRSWFAPLRRLLPNGPWRLSPASLLARPRRTCG